MRDFRGKGGIFREKMSDFPLKVGIFGKKTRDFRGKGGILGVQMSDFG